MADLQTLFSSVNITFALTSFLLIYSYIWYKKTYSFWSRRGVSGPTPWPLVGSVWPLFFDTYKNVDLDNFRKFGHVYGYYDGTKPVLAISDPVILEKIFISNFQDFSNFLEITSQDPLDFNQIMAQDSQAWRRHRAVVSTCFSSSKMKTVGEKTRVCKKTMVKYLHSLKGQEVDAKKVFRLYTLDSIGKVLFSVDVNAFDNQDCQMVKSVGDFFVKFTAWNLFVLNTFPAWIGKYLSKAYDSEDTMEYLKSFVSHVVKSRKSDADRRDDLVQTLIDAKNEKCKVDQDGKGLSEIEVVANAVFLFGASYDSSIQTLCSAVFYLAHNPHVQDKMLDEVNSISKGEHISYDELNQMNYLEAVVTETLRLESPDARGFRRAVRDTVIPGTDIKVPKDQLISILFYVSHFDEANYDEPYKFRPERFLDDQGNKKKKSPFYAFGDGQRMCAGIRLAYLSQKESLATIVRNFRIEKGPSTPDAIVHDAGAVALYPSNFFVSHSVDLEAAMGDLQTIASSVNIAIVLTSFLLIYCYRWYKSTYSFWSSRGVDGPTPWPIIGSVWPLFSQPYRKVDVDNFKKYGNLYGYYDGTKPVLAISDPVILEKIYISNFHDFANFLETTTQDAIERNHSMAQDGDNWKRHRAVLSSCFTSSKLKQNAEKTRPSKQAMMKYIHSLNGSEIDAKKIFALYSLDAIFKVLFSVNVNAFENQDSQVVTTVGDFFVTFTAWNLFVLNTFPAWAGPYLSMSHNTEDMMSYLKSLAYHTVKSRKCEADRRDDLVQVLIDAHSSAARIEQEGKGLTELEVIANSVFLFGASYDSSKLTLSSAIYHLACNPHIQDKILSEINEVCKSDVVTYEELNQLIYLEAVVMETLRIESADARGFRRAVRDTVIPGTDIRVPKDQLISICFYAAHVDEAHYEKPTQFIPERFLDDKGNINKKLPFYAFGGGQRMCPGFRSAYLDQKESLVTILRDFKIEKGPNTPDAIVHGPGSIASYPSNFFVRFARR
ncbi:Cytochrome P450 3A21 [Halotydeus destructor]|nr:Cytochrome P450 3A21 [Halotydeus destructor]